MKVKQIELRTSGDMDARIDIPVTAAGVPVPEYVVYDGVLYHSARQVDGTWYYNRQYGIYDGERGAWVEEPLNRQPKVCENPCGLVTAGSVILTPRQKPTDTKKVMAVDPVDEGD